MSPLISELIKSKTTTLDDLRFAVNEVNWQCWLATEFKPKERQPK